MNSVRKYQLLHQSETYHNPISWIVIGGNRIGTSVKEGRDFFHGSLIHDTTFIHQNQIIKRFENIGRRLVDRKEHTGACVRNLFQYLTQLNRRITIQSTGGFVQKDQRWFLFIRKSRSLEHCIVRMNDMTDRQIYIYIYTYDD